jgi:Iap family predicted aminopeptidase
MREQHKSDTFRYGEPQDHIKAVNDVVRVVANDSKLAVVTDFGLNFVSDGHPDYHEYDVAMFNITAQHFKLIGEVMVTLMGKLMSFNQMYKEIEIFRKFVDKHVKLIVEVDGERHDSIEVRIRDGVTQMAALNKWNVPEGSMKFVRLKKADCSSIQWIRERLWGMDAGAGGGMK